MAALAISLVVPVGQIRTIGEYGPMYEVVSPASRSFEGDPLVTIRVIETGETLDYKLTSMLSDPEAA